MPRGQWPDREKQLAHLAQWRAEASGRSAYTQAGRAARAKGGRTRAAIPKTKVFGSPHP